jgi:uncharacterized protein
MRKRAPVITLVFCITFFLAASVDAENAKSFLWKVQSETTSVYLLGSIHFMKKDIYPLNKKIEEAFEKADILAVEANVNDIGQIDMQQLMSTAFYPGEETLEKHVSRETYELILKESGKIGFPQVIIDRQRPWFLALTLTSLELLREGFDPDFGIDMHFLSKASGKKKIRELESAEYQIRLLSGFSDDEQEAFLLYTIKDLSSLKNDLDTLLAAWSTGDTKTMESLITKSIAEDKGMSSMFEKLIYKRNSDMVTKIEGFLQAKETCFVIVGAGHLVGERGIVEMLKKKGFKVEQL